MRMKKFLAVMLSAIIVMCAIPFTAYADSAEILEIDGERIALVSSFGKMAYEGKTRVTFRNFADAFNALGIEGGTIAFTGNLKVGEFNDIDGRKDITIRGTGAKPINNILDFTGASEINLKGNLILDYLHLKTNAGAYVLTNGYKLETINEFDTYQKEIYIPGGTNIMEHQDSPSLSIGEVSGEVNSLYLTLGKFDTLTAGAVNEKTVSGDTVIKVAGAGLDNLVAGSVSGTHNGNSKVFINDGEVGKLIAGSLGGTVNGNVIAQIDGGTVKNITVGAQEGAVINGNVVLYVNNDEVDSRISAGKGEVKGKTIIVANVSSAAQIASSAADIIVKLDGGLCYPQFEGTALKGFLITDKSGIPAKEINVNGSSKKSANGIYQLEKGLHTIKVETKVGIQVNKNAKYVEGRGNGIFAPQDNMTKAEAVTLLSRLIIDEKAIKGKIASDFKDVGAGEWYESYIGMFEKLGFLEFVADTSGYYFEPNKNITRAEFTQLLYKIATIDGEAAATKFTAVPDVESTSVYKPAVSFAMSAGIITGYEDGTFRPDNNITRAEVVTMVNRFIGRKPTGVAGSINFSDIDHWAKDQILAACNSEGVSWTSSVSGNEYVLTGTSAKEYVTALYEQGKTLGADAIRRGIDTVSDQIKKDVLSTPNTEEIYGDKITGKKYYISEKNGDDKNNGESPETAFKTIEGAFRRMRFLKPGTAILFERGGVYRGSVNIGDRSPGLIFGSYGTGEKPLLMQSKKNYADESLWVRTEWPNIWRCTDKLDNVGIIAFDHDVYDYSENTYNELYGRALNVGLGGVTGVFNLEKDLQFYSVLENDGSNNVSVNVGDLFVYSAKGNPGKRFASIEIGENLDVMDGSSDDIIIDNLAFKFAGGHGISSFTCKNRTVTNCVFSWIGGSILDLNYNGSGIPVNYGNAVEIYGGCDGYFVENCWMYQIYDTGVTHQYAETLPCVQQNVRYTGNLIELCHWGIEFYNNNDNGKNPKNKKYTKDVEIRYNIVNKCGYGWGSILRNTTWRSFAYCGDSLATNSECYTEYNVFNLCGGYMIYLPENSNEEPDKNIIIQHTGNRLGFLKGVDRYCTGDVANYIAEDYGDKNAIVILINHNIEPTPSREIPAVPENK